MKSTSSLCVLSLVATTLPVLRQLSAVRTRISSTHSGQRPCRTSWRSSTNLGSRCRCTWRSSRDVCTHWRHAAVWKQKTGAGSPLREIGGSCRKSPHRTSLIPPNGRSLRRTRRATRSSFWKKRPSSIETSSTTRTLQRRHCATQGGLWARSTICSTVAVPVPTPANA
uniref:Secreted protein n=1 Tax=Ixodes ricinus TaxID=34613 RepID=A0A6B0UYL7_IXORI